MALGKGGNPSKKIDPDIAYGRNHGSTFFHHGCEGCSWRQQTKALGIQLPSLQRFSSEDVMPNEVITSCRALTFANC
jgi:hypothetical protein